MTESSAAPDLDGASSALRAKIVDELLPDVVPSKYHELRFLRLTFGLTKLSPVVTSDYTTCAALPVYVARMLGDRAIGGTDGVRAAGVRHGAWVEAGGDARPLPGDIYALLDDDETDRAAGAISHVGVVVDAFTDEWRTADAGLGDGWTADYVTREYDPTAGTLSGAILAGWIDVDRYPVPWSRPSYDVPD
ncbi:MAG TPA: hypothetical protein VFO49_12765 [Nocardioides sp.]|nr:hypothetical protein [Nocardioides sp.]